MRNNMDNNVVDLIMNDHRELEHLFEELKSKPDRRSTLVPLMLTLLTAHSRAEEAEVYPAATEAGIAKDVQHSQKEHLEADQLAAAVAATDPNSPDFDRKLEALVDAVTHHVGEEESSVLPGMQENLTRTRLDELGRAFLEARKKHLGDMPEDITKTELQTQAANADITGVSDKRKAELQDDLKSAAEE